MQEVVVDTQNDLKHNELEVIYSRLAPWEVHLYQLISWWYMEQFSAKRFYNIAVLLERIKCNY